MLLHANHLKTKHPVLIQPLVLTSCEVNEAHSQQSSSALWTFGNLEPPFRDFLIHCLTHWFRLFNNFWQLCRKTDPVKYPLILMPVQICVWSIPEWVCAVCTRAPVMTWEQCSTALPHVTSMGTAAKHSPTGKELRLLGGSKNELRHRQASAPYKHISSYK